MAETVPLHEVRAFTCEGYARTALQAEAGAVQGPELLPGFEPVLATLFG